MGERGREIETRAVRVCAHVTQRGMTKEGDKARTHRQRGLVARESANSENEWRVRNEEGRKTRIASERTREK